MAVSSSSITDARGGARGLRGSLSTEHLFRSNGQIGVVASGHRACCNVLGETHTFLMFYLVAGRNEM